MKERKLRVNPKLEKMDVNRPFLQGEALFASALWNLTLQLVLSKSFFTIRLVPQPNGTPHIALGSTDVG